MSSSNVNQTEWENDANWGGYQGCNVYFSKKDTRLWVPKKIPTHGWTINFAHPAGAYILVAICFGIPFLIMLVFGFICLAK